jgi:hypothetical protein
MTRDRAVGVEWWEVVHSCGGRWNRTNCQIRGSSDPKSRPGTHSGSALHIAMRVPPARSDHLLAGGLLPPGWTAGIGLLRRASFLASLMGLKVLLGVNAGGCRKWRISQLRVISDGSHRVATISGLDDLACPCSGPQARPECVRVRGYVHARLAHEAIKRSRPHRLTSSAKSLNSCLPGRCLAVGADARRGHGRCRTGRRLADDCRQRLDEMLQPLQLRSELIELLVLRVVEGSHLRKLAADVLGICNVDR